MNDHDPMTTEANGPAPTCAHENFKSGVTVVRLTATEEANAPVIGYTAEVRVQCAACEEPFIWMGLPSGILPNQPAVSIDGLEARMPLRPLSAEEEFGRALLGYSIRLGGGDD